MLSDSPLIFSAETFGKQFFLVFSLCHPAADPICRKNTGPETPHILRWLWTLSGASSIARFPHRPLEFWNPEECRAEWFCATREKEEAKPQAGWPCGSRRHHHPTSGSPGSAYWSWVSVSPPFSVSFLLSLSPSHPFLGVVLFLRRRYLSLLFPLQRKGRWKIPLRNTPLLFCKLEKRSKNLFFSVPLEGILSSEGAWVRNDRILILRLRVDILGLHSLPLPQFVSHFLTHSVSPTLITLFSISSFLWLLLLQFIFTHEESINHLIVRYKNISNSF